MRRRVSRSAPSGQKPGRAERTGGGLRLDRDLTRIRKAFPVLERGVYLISNSLGAVPITARAALLDYYEIWAREGVKAWEKTWWDLGIQVGDRVAKIIGARPGTVTMMTNATQAHWTALSTRFLPEATGSRRKVVLSDQDFPSMIYAVQEISRALNWEPVIVPGRGAAFDIGPLLEAIDDRTLFVATSHVHYKTACIQDIREICVRARRHGALSLIDGYHAPGVIPVDVQGLGADFYVGGCLKWLCGGPGTAFLYVRPETSTRARPALTGWAAHRAPFLFNLRMAFAEKSRGFQSGSPPVPCLYTARAGLDMISRVGLREIRAKSLRLTGLLISRAEERGYPLLTPRGENRRAGHVAFHVPHGLAVKLALDERGVMTDFRKGGYGEVDVLRVGPHFYNSEDEVEVLFRELDRILSGGAHKKFLRSRVSVS